MLKPATEVFAAATAGFDFNPDFGLAILEAIDCSMHPAGGVEFRIHDVEADQFYLVNQLPDAKATVTVYDETNDTGDGGFLNVPPGFIRFSAHWGVDGPELKPFDAYIAPKTVTFIEMDF